MKNKSKNSILLRTLLLSTSIRNIGKYGKDKKSKKKVTGNIIGMLVLLLMLVMYMAFAAIGLGAAGLGEYIPLMSALIVSGMSFLFTFFRANGYLFNFKEYDMLMALPFPEKDVAGCKFLYMYIKNGIWYICISLSMLIGYGIFVRPSVFVYPIWIILSFFLPVIPMLLASFVGFLIAKVSSGFKKKNIIQTVITLVFVLFCFSLQYIIDAIFKNNEPMEVAQKTADITGQIGTYYFPAIWFSKAITMFSEKPVIALGFAVALVVLTVLLFEAVFMIVGKNYRQINSALKSHGAKRDFRLTGQKGRSVLRAIAYKEWKRFTGSTTYLVNGGMGFILIIILSVVVFFIGFDKLVFIITKGAPMPVEIVYPAIPFVVYFFVGMMSTTACSPSLEGKNYWIIQSLPLEKKTLYQGKMLFNLYLSVPSMCIGILCFSIAAGIELPLMILHLILGFACCLFSTTWGCVCGVKHMRLDWENEVEVIKQGMAVALYLFPNMIVTTGLVVLVCWLGTFVNPYLIDTVAIVIVFLMALFSYLRVLSLIKKN